MSAVATSDLILAAQSGDAAALSNLLAACQADVRRYARRHCHASDVDDAVQEALLTVARKVSALKVAAAFSSWLFVMIKRECQRLGRAIWATESLDDSAMDAQLASRSDEGLRIDLAKALESLPPHYLEVVLLRDFEELTIAEIAERLNEQAGAIKSRLHRARELVREYLLAGRSLLLQYRSGSLASLPSHRMDHQPDNPLHGATLQHIVECLAEHYGWAELGYLIPIRCFTHDPSVSSSLKFLRRTPWAREKVEALYVETWRRARGL